MITIKDMRKLVKSMPKTRDQHCIALCVDGLAYAEIITAQWFDSDGMILLTIDPHSEVGRVLRARDPDTEETLEHDRKREENVRNTVNSHLNEFLSDYEHSDQTDEALMVKEFRKKLKGAIRSFKAAR